ncbi:MAG: MlaD family protein [Treponema sp.]|jgi:phospholipid/cholesterol/gamma-HCH transport system substrate-binding protein|nr:MlaD family protein [Treponema sp.]
MKFKIRFVDQIVGLLIVTALASLIVVIFFLGRAQRWFSRDYYYRTYAASGSGLNENMPVIYKGFTIGTVKKVDLTAANEVEVIFTIQDKYNDRARFGSVVEILVSPLAGLGGSQFNFYPGLGEGLKENDVIPMVDSAEGKDLAARGLAYIPPRDDTITILIAKANLLLDDLHTMLESVNTGSGTPLGETMTNIRKSTEDLIPVVGNIKKMTGDLSAELPVVAGDLEASLADLSLILNHVEETTSYLPDQMPQIISMISELRSSILAAEDVLIALRNNPLLRNGIPEHAETDVSGTNPRNISF